MYSLKCPTEVNENFQTIKYMVDHTVDQVRLLKMTEPNPIFKIPIHSDTVGLVQPANCY